MGRLAVETKYFPLYEIRDGREYRVTYQPKGLPVEEYLMIQERFKDLDESDLKTIQAEVDLRWQELTAKASGS